MAFTSASSDPSRPALKKSLGRAFMTFEELQTILCEIEAAINNRPLAYLSEDDLDEALTPFHLMNGRSIGKRAQSVDLVFPSNIEQCKRRLIHVRKVLRDFWMRFRLYLFERTSTNEHLSQVER